MIDLSSFFVFITTSIVVILMPGPAMIYIIKNGISRGKRPGISAAYGTTLGVAFHVLCAAFGLAALMKTSAAAFQVVKYAGAAYLIYMAIKTWRSQEPLFADMVISEKSEHSIFWQGFFINILNPKLSIFFLAYLPQFTQPHGLAVTTQVLILGALFMGMTVIIFIGYGLFASIIRRTLSGNARIDRLMKGIFASAFGALGVKLALADR